MVVKIQTYAALKDHFENIFEIDVAQGETLAAVKNHLTRMNPSSFGLLEKCRFAINLEIAEHETLLKEGDSIDILPPSSGG